LDRAATTGHADIVRLLLANHADVNARNNDGMTPLYGAAESGYTEVAILLLASRANVNAEPTAAIHRFTLLPPEAQGRDSTAAGQWCDVNAKAEDGSTPLHGLWPAPSDVMTSSASTRIDLIAAQPHTFCSDCAGAEAFPPKCVAAGETPTWTVRYSQYLAKLVSVSKTVQSFTRTRPTVSAWSWRLVWS